MNSVKQCVVWFKGESKETVFECVDKYTVMERESDNSLLIPTTNQSMVHVILSNVNFWFVREIEREDE